MPSEVEYDGWSAVPRSLSTLVANRSSPQPSKPMKVSDIPLPSSDLITAITEYARTELPEPTFHHSMRAFYWGSAIATQHFPEWQFGSVISRETYLLACLLHDIGTTDKNIASTRLSFEFRGGMLARDLLLKHGASQSQAEAVAETVIRHQDIGDSGNVMTLTAIIFFATLFDNVGGNPELVHPDTIKSVVEAWPRQKWTGCFAGTIRKETSLKPWSHTTVIEGFAEKVEANELMRPYDDAS